MAHLAVRVAVLVVMLVLVVQAQLVKALRVALLHRPETVVAVVLVRLVETALVQVVARVAQV